MRRQQFQDPPEPQIEEDVVTALADAALPPIPPAQSAPVTRTAPPVTPASATPAATHVGAQDTARTAANTADRPRAGKPARNPKKGRKSTPSSISGAAEGPRGTLYKTMHDHLVLMELALEYARAGLPTDHSFILFDCLYRLHPQKRPTEGPHARPARK